MTQPENPDLEVEINADEKNNTITIKFESNEREIVVGFDIEEAQMLNLALSNAIANLLDPETCH